MWTTGANTHLQSSLAILYANWQVSILVTLPWEILQLCYQLGVSFCGTLEYMSKIFISCAFLWDKKQSQAQCRSSLHCIKRRDRAQAWIFKSAYLPVLDSTSWVIAVKFWSLPSWLLWACSEMSLNVIQNAGLALTIDKCSVWPDGLHHLALFESIELS